MKQPKQQTFEENAFDDLRIAGYPNGDVYEQLMQFCERRNFDRNTGLRVIMQAVLNPYGDSSDAALSKQVAALEKKIKELESVVTC